VEADLRTRSDAAAEFHELVRAEVVVLRDSPRLVEPGGPLIEWPDAVLPVISAAKVAAIAQKRRVKLLGIADDFGIQCGFGIRRVEADFVERTALAVIDRCREIHNFEWCDNSRRQSELEWPPDPLAATGNLESGVRENLTGLIM